MSSTIPGSPGSASPPWDQLPGEPGHWYQRFTRFRLAGPGRSVLGLYRAERHARSLPGRVHSIPHRWQAAIARWHWRERVAAWDAAEREQMLADYEADRLAARADRLRILRA